MLGFREFIFLGRIMCCTTRTRGNAFGVGRPAPKEGLTISEQL